MFHNKQILDSNADSNGKLHARYYPSEQEGRPLILLHGLLGSSRNWGSIARAFSRFRPVWALDLPDHGNSHWTDQPAFSLMAESIYAWMEGEGLREADWVGHSLGGKVALRMAWQHPEKVSSIVLADIFPKVYQPHHKSHMKAMLDLPLSAIGSRKDADTLLQSCVENWALRQFLLTNLERDASSGSFYWLPNLIGLYQQLEKLAALSIPEEVVTPQPTLLLYAGKSDFVIQEDLQRMPDLFSQFEVRCLEAAGHNLHVEDRDGFLREVMAFLEKP